MLKNNSHIFKRLFFFVSTILIVIFTSFFISGCFSTFSVPIEHYKNIETEPINKNASTEVKNLMQFLGSIYGEYVISGQYISKYENYDLPQFKEDEFDANSPRTVFKANELQAIYKTVNQFPAMLGVDLSGAEYGDVDYSIEQAVQWNNAGGIVTISWHWKIDNLDGKPRAFYTKETDFNLANVLKNKNSTLFQNLLLDIDNVAKELKILENNNVPVLWRPLHEASGGWFWWGASGKNAYLELWDILYDRLVNYHNLNNLIWVYNGLSPEWYVGDNKCDIVSYDSYYSNPKRKNYEKDSVNSKAFEKCYNASSNKIIMLSENDFIFNIDKAFEKNMKWLSFCTWCREFVCESYINENGKIVYKPEYNEAYSTKEELVSVYSNNKVLSLEKLIKLRNLN